MVFGFASIELFVDLDALDDQMNRMHRHKHWNAAFACTSFVLLYHSKRCFDLWSGQAAFLKQSGVIKGKADSFLHLRDLDDTHERSLNG